LDDDDNNMASFLPSFDSSCFSRVSAITETARENLQKVIGKICSKANSGDFYALTGVHIYPDMKIAFEDEEALVDEDKSTERKAWVYASVLLSTETESGDVYTTEVMLVHHKNAHTLKFDFRFFKGTNMDNDDIKDFDYSILKGNSWKKSQKIIVNLACLHLFSHALRCEGEKNAHVPAVVGLVDRLLNSFLVHEENLAAYMLLHHCIPVVESSYGGKTCASVGLMAQKGRLCQAIGMKDAAIKCFKGVCDSHNLLIPHNEGEQRRRTREKEYGPGGVERVTAYGYFGKSLQESSLYREADKVYKEGFRGVPAEHVGKEVSFLRYNRVILMEVLNGRDSSHHVNSVYDLFGGEANIYQELDPDYPRPRVKRNGVVVETERCRFLTVYVTLLFRNSNEVKHSQQVLFYNTETESVEKGSYEDFSNDALDQIKKKKSSKKKKKKKKKKPQQTPKDQGDAKINVVDNKMA
jgi:hypothetical protein